MVCSGECVWMLSKILGVPPECAGVLVVGMGTVFLRNLVNLIKSGQTRSKSDQIWSNRVKI